MWTAPRLWPGETVFVLASGPSLNKIDLSLLKGRRVIAVKSSWLMYPDADVLFFADGRWWQQPLLRPKDFGGLIVTTAPGIPAPVKPMKKVPPTALSADPTCLALARTSTTGAINLAVHFTGPGGKIVGLGVDGRLAPNGQRHCHGLKWPWAKGAEQKSFDDQAAEYRAIAPSAKAMGVEIVNGNLESAIDAFPRLSFEECLA